MNGDFIVADAFCLASVCVRMRMDIGQVAVLAYLCRFGASEAMDVAAATGLSKSRMYRKLEFMRSKGEVRMAERRKDYYRRVVQLWEVTEKGRKAALTLEAIYRELVAKLIEGRL